MTNKPSTDFAQDGGHPAILPSRCVKYIILERLIGYVITRESRRGKLLTLFGAPLIGLRSFLRFRPIVERFFDRRVVRVKVGFEQKYGRQASSHVRNFSNL